MAGVTEAPFRGICKRMGAALTYTEMISAKGLHYNPDARVTRELLSFDPAEVPCGVQLFGSDPALMADRAAWVLERYGSGVALIDINMGCPARKVCRVLAGSALLRDEPLVARILEAVVEAARVPVTLKIRTGWDAAHKNAPRIARMAEESGIQALAIHGRTRACMFAGQAEYDTIAAVKASARIPIIANGDISSPEKARAVLSATGADGIMIGRAALGRPWIFREILHYLATGERLPPPSPAEFRAVLLGHLDALHAFYGERAGVGIARKHIAWYTRGLPDSAAFRRRVFQLPTAALQRSAVERFLSERAEAEQGELPVGTAAR